MVLVADVLLGFPSKHQTLPPLRPLRSEREAPPGSGGGGGVSTCHPPVSSLHIKNHRFHIPAAVAFSLDI